MTYDELNIRSRKVAAQLTTDPAIKWTGWKFSLHSDGLVAQWIDLHEHEGQRYYVNLPGMQQGSYLIGSEFEIGNARAYTTDDFGYIADLIRDGFTQLMAHREVAA